MLVALVSALDCSVRQAVVLIALFLMFMLLDHSLYAKLWRGIRISLPFFAGYWLFATLFKTEFPAMVAFTLRLLLLITVTVFCLGKLTLPQVLRDTSWLRRHRLGERLVRYMLATNLYIRAYAKYFAQHKPRIRSSIGEIIDNMLGAGAHVLGNSPVIEAQLGYALKLAPSSRKESGSNLIDLCLLALLVLVSSL